MALSLDICFVALDETDVLSRTFGFVTRVDEAAASTTWEARQETLLDPATFGPSRDFVCECGAVSGRQRTNAICTQCGVAVGKASRMRRRRFGAIRLPRRVSHPIVHGAHLTVLPVIPVAYRTGLTREGLGLLYLDVVRAVDSCEERVIEDSVARLFCNEWTATPRIEGGLIVQSLLGRLLHDPATTLVDWGIYLTAMCLRIDTAAPEHA